MDGPPDHEEIHNQNLLDELESTSKRIKDELGECKDKLIERMQKRDSSWKDSRERIIFEEDIKGKFDSCESQLAHLRQIFKEYQHRNKLKIPPEEIRARTRNIDLLRQQINLLKAEFRTQSEREHQQRQHVGHLHPDSSNMVLKKRAQSQQKEFVQLFGINAETEEDERGHELSYVEEEERDLNREEEEILKAFRENDAELETIAHTIVEELKKVKMNAENIEAGIDRQTELLGQVNQRADKNLSELKQQSNDLKAAINKHKSGKQCCFDLCLLLTWLGLLTICIKLFQSKGYI